MIKTSFHKSEKEWRLIIRLPGPGDLSRVDVVHNQRLTTVYKIAFPEKELYEQGPKLSTLGAIIDSIMVGPRADRRGIEHAIRTLTYKRWGGFWPVRRSSGTLAI
jgi:hypothetical protein